MQAGDEADLALSERVSGALCAALRTCDRDLVQQAIAQLALPLEAGLVGQACRGGAVDMPLSCSGVGEPAHE